MKAVAHAARVSADKHRLELMSCGRAVCTPAIEIDAAPGDGPLADSDGARKLFCGDHSIDC